MLLSNPITTTALTAISNVSELAHSALSELGEKANATTMRWGVGFYALLAGPLADPTTPTTPTCTPINGVSTTTGGLNLSWDGLRQWMIGEWFAIGLVIVMLCLGWWGISFFNQSWGQRAVGAIRRLLLFPILLLAIPFLIAITTSIIKVSTGQDYSCYIPTK